MAVDNPWYFSLSGGAASSTKTTTTTTTSTSTSSSKGHGSGLSALFRRRAGKMGAASSQGGIAEPESGASMHHHGGGRGSSASAGSTPTEEHVSMLSRNITIHPGCGKRRSFRNLFRSMSANADHAEKTQKFLKGDPRPSDVAPLASYLPHRSYSHSEKDRHRPGRDRRALKSTSELLSNDMIYCGLAENSKNHNGDDNNSNNDDNSNDDDGTADVFLSVDNSRYYNLSSTLPMASSTTACRRRHSIGTFLGKEACAFNNAVITGGRQQTGGSRNLLETDPAATPMLIDDIDGIPCNENEQMSCNKIRRRRYRNASNKGPQSGTTVSKDGHGEDDVLFVSSKESEASNLWVKYLTACFEQISRQQGRPPFKIRHLVIEEPIAPKTEKKIRSSRLQIVVVCPILLDRIRISPEHAVHLTSHLVAEKVLAMMLGVHDSHINDSHRSNLVSYDQWRKFFVKDQDETFVGELLGAAIAILGTAPPATLRNDKTAFSVHPKKVKLGQNKIIALLNDPLSPEDNVSVVVDRCGDAIDISNVKRRNPYALQFSIPEKCLEVSMLVGVRISKNGCALGVRQVKCESRLRELDQILRAYDNPLEFMCQTFGFSSTDREQLDNWMVHAFQKNMPPHFSLLSTPSGMVPAHRNHTSSEENPTFLHFAARFGLEKLAWQLLECPGGDLACDLKNVSDLTPADLAEQAGHTRLAHQLRGYMQMNEFTNMYSYLKVISQTTNRSTGTNSATDVPSVIANEINNEQEDYCQPRPLSEVYLVPPVARPVTTLIPTMLTTTIANMTADRSLNSNYSTVPTPMPVMFSSASSVTSNGLDLSFQGYMKMHAGAKTTTTNNANLPSSRTDTPTQDTRQEVHQNSLGAREDNCSQKICYNLPYGRTSSNSSTKSREPSGPQDELLEIINDFKNNVFTISEVERLVENWQKRNDVQQSFKDKQRQLMAMREEYDRIQKKLKEEMKTPTPFDKIRKFFSKGKKDAKESATTVTDLSSSKSEGINGGLADHRPVSSLSLRSVSSSSSSGRMSTISGCSGLSLSDSGTHSDSEDRKLQNARDEKASMTFYEIPPTPKPFTGKSLLASGYSPLPIVSVTRDLDLRQVQSLSKADHEHYIAFPPSGLPVYAFKANGSPREPDTPSSPCERPKYPDFAQNVIIPSDKHQEETNAMKQHTNNNNYVNTDPSPSNGTPIPSGMCIPDCANGNVAASADSAHVDQENAKERHSDFNDTCGHDTEACSEITRMKPSLSQSTVDEVDSAPVSQGQEGAGVIYDQQHVPADSMSVVRNTSKVSETRMPEYMNLAVNMGQDVINTLGAIPKKLPGPPVPPRGMTFHVFHANGAMHNEQ
ncbi:phosphoinositide 3-kinase adapter protein 1 isoform X1 [Ooceraea biroi]|uniref:phosphoinositide 3-kinase adapter protein 1 isoform X1 n=1 Tax=Ooceraea biroi TaxID=2015173 RepID=UPI000F08FB1C|nr:phosphoinositide 3-kinase adapter protein 1 isoform X1 [Ooceraea biroi]